MNSIQDTIKSCPFCSPNIELSEFIGTTDYAAIYNAAPIVPGHSLVIPRAHLQRISDLDDESFTGFWLFARSVTEFLKSAYQTDAFDWTVQEQEAAGQSVPHLHLHVIPRLEGDLESPGARYRVLRGVSSDGNDGDEIDSKDRRKLSDEERREIVVRLRRAWSTWKDGV